MKSNIDLILSHPVFRDEMTVFLKELLSENHDR